MEISLTVGEWREWKTKGCESSLIFKWNIEGLTLQHFIN